MRRPLRWLLRIAVVAVVLVAIGLAAFTWFAYWPLEGKAPSVEALVPRDVDFVYRARWSELKPWLVEHFVDRPVHESLAPERMEYGAPDRAGRRATVADALARIPETEAQINDSIPPILKTLEGLLFGSREFRVEKDLFAGEVVAAGRWCGGGSPSQGPPKWREILLVTRVSPVVKFAFEALRHDFVRRRVALPPDVTVESTREGWLRFELHGVPKPRRKETCEGGLEMGPLDVWTVARTKDVLAVTNSEDLAAGLSDHARSGGGGVVDRPGFALEDASGGVAAAVDLTGLRSYLNRFFAPADPSDRVGAFLGKFFAVDTLDRMNAVVEPLPGNDGVLARAVVEYDTERLREFRDVSATYELSPSSVASGIARLVPEKDTAIVASLRTPPRALLRALYGSLSPSDQRLVEDRVADIGRQRRGRGETGYKNVGEFLDELAGQLGFTTGVAVARIPAVFDRVRYAEWYSNDDPVPTAALAVMVKISEGATQEEVSRFLSDRVNALGFYPPKEARSPGGEVTYSRLEMRPLSEGKEGEPARLPRDYESLTPAFKVADGHLILSTREDYLVEILKTMAGGPAAPPAVANSREFRAATRSLPPEATVAVYVSGENLRRLAWDYRNDVVRRLHDDVSYAREARSAIHRRFSAQGKSITDLDAVNEEVDREVDRYRREEYPRFVDEYRRSLDSWSRLAAAAFVLAADRSANRLAGGGALLFAEK